MKRAYKGFNADMTCQGFKYREGETYTEEKADLCECGFHACENPLDCLRYYRPTDGAVYHEVELEGVTDQRDTDTKICGTTIRIGPRVDLGDLIQEGVQLIISDCKEGNIENNFSQGDRSTSASQGFCSKSASLGDGSTSASKGDNSTSASSGTGSTSASFGGNSKSASQGNCSTSVSLMDDSTSASQGFCSASSSQGDRCMSASLGDGSKSEVKGENCIAAALGHNVQARASKGSWIVLSEIDKDGNILDVQAHQVDGEKIKVDTWYKLVNGKLIIPFEYETRK